MATNAWIELPVTRDIGGSVTIGDIILGGIPGSVLFIGPAGDLAQDPTDFIYNSTTNALTITGVFTSSNISGTNTGDVTLAGENYLSIAAQVITANPVNLSNTNVTGNLPVTHLNSGTGASSSTFWRGDGTWTNISLTTNVTGILPLINGGTSAALTASNGSVVYSTAAALALSAVGSTGQLLRSAGAGTPTWTAETFPASTVINELLYSSATNVVSGLATAATSALRTSSAGVPSWASGTTANRVLRTNGTTISFAQVVLTTDVSGILPAANGGTGSAALTAGRIVYTGTGGVLATSALMLWDNTLGRAAFGNPGNARLSTTVTSGGDLALNAYSQGTNNCIQGQNQNAWTCSLVNAGLTAVGAAVNFEASRGTLTARTQTLSGDVMGTINSQGYTGTTWNGFGGAIQFIASEDVTTTNQGAELVFLTTPNGSAAPIERLRIKNSGVVNISNLTASLPVQTNASKDLISLAINLASAQVSGILPVANGGTGSATQNYVDLTTNQSIAGDKTFTGSVLIGSGAAAATNAPLVIHNGHIKSTQTTAPTIAADASAGTGATASLARATDVAGEITINTGTIGLGTGSYATITFNSAYNVAPIVVLTPAGSTLSTSVYVTATTTTFSVNFAIAGGISSTYVINYHVIETQ